MEINENNFVTSKAGKPNGQTILKFFLDSKHLLIRKRATIFL